MGRGRNEKEKMKYGNGEDEIEKKGGTHLVQQRSWN